MRASLDGIVNRTPDQLREIVARYNAAWAELDEERRLSDLEASWPADGAYVDTENPEGLIGRQQLSDSIGGAHEDMPGLTITLTGEIQILGD